MYLNIQPGFTVFGKTFQYYGLLMIAGFLIGAFMAVWRTKKYGIEKIEIVYASIFAAGGGILGAKLLAIITYIPKLISHEVTFLGLLLGGFVFYGGLLGGIGGLLIYAKIFKLDVLKYFDMFAPSVPLGHALGRIGCLFSGCCYGIPYSGPISIIYPDSYEAYGTPVGVELLPVQLIECFCLLIIYGVTEFLYYRTKKCGISLCTYILSYCMLRFTLEFFRGDIVRGVLLGLSTSQWISLIIFIAVVSFLILSFVKKRKNLQAS